MDKQLVFTTVKAALTKQGTASITGSGSCRYRDNNGNKCAVGHLIPDDRYRPVLEGKSCYNNRVLDAIDPALNVDTDLGGDDVGFLRALQSAHDTQLAMSGLPAWEARMADIAASYDLENI